MENDSIPSSHLLRTRYAHPIQPHLNFPREITPEENVSKVSSSEWLPDQLLQYMQNSQLIDSEGNSIADFFDVNFFLYDQIILVKEQLLSKGISAQTSGIEFVDDQGKKHIFPISLVDLIYEIFRRLGNYQSFVLQNKFSPEIIGGAVPHLLTGRFYISYLQKRLRMPYALAEKMITPFLQSLCSGPNDYDYRQWVDEGEFYLESKAIFKAHFGHIIKEILDSISKNTIPESLVKDCCFTKLNWVDTEESKFGIAAIRQFNHVPLECIVTEKNERPFLFTRDRIALVLNFQRKPSGGLDVLPNLVFYDLPGHAPINPEIALIHQLTMVLDTPTYERINPRGWLIAMTLSSKGWRALKRDFFPSLWRSFADKNCVLNRIVIDSLKQEIRWVEENHLCPPLQTDLYLAQRIALRVNLLIYFIDNDHLVNKDLLWKFIEEIQNLRGPSTGDFSGFVLDSLLTLLQNPKLPFKESLAWFRIGLWVHAVNQGIPEGGISFNFGETCYRLENHDVHASVCWIPLKIVDSLNLIMFSVQKKPTVEWSKSLAEFFEKFTQFRSAHLTSQGDHLKQMISREFLKTFLNVVKRSHDPHINKIALDIELGLKKGILSIDWLLYMQVVVREYPDLLGQFDRALPKSSIDQSNHYTKKDLQNPASWLLYLVESHPHQSVSYAHHMKESDKEQFKVLMRSIESEPQRYLSIYHKLRGVKEIFDMHRIHELLFDLLRPGLPASFSSLTSSEGREFIPWILLLISLKGSTDRCEVHLLKDSSNNGNLIFLVKDTTIKVHISILPICEEAIRIFQKNNENSKLCLELFDHVFFNNDNVTETPPAFSFVPLQSKLANFIGFLRKFAIETPQFELGFMLTLYNRTSPLERLQIPVQWLVNYPEIISEHPRLRIHFLEYAKRNNLGSYFCDTLENESVTRSEWIMALISVKQINFLTALGILWRKIRAENIEEGEQIWFHIKKMLLENIEAIPKILNSIGPIDFTQGEQKQFITEWILSPLHSRVTRYACINFILHELKDMFPRNENETSMQFFIRMTKELTTEAQTEKVPSTTGNVVKSSQFQSVVEKQFFMMSLYFPYTVVAELGRLFYNFYNHYVTDKNVFHPIEFFCLRSITLHKIILDKFQGYPGDGFCPPETFSDREIYYYDIAGVYLFGVTTIAALGVFNHFRSLSKKDASQPLLKQKNIQVSLGSTLIFKIKNLLGNYLNPIVTILALYGTFSSFEAINDFSEHPKLPQYIKRCYNFAPVYLAQELNNAEKLKLIPKSALTGKLQNGICDFNLEENSLDEKIFFTFLICQLYLTTLYFGSVFRPLISRTIGRVAPNFSKRYLNIQPVAKQKLSTLVKNNLVQVLAKHRLLFIFSNLAYGIFNRASALEDEFNHARTANENCVNRISYLSPTLGKNVNSILCPPLPDDSVRFTMISYILVFTVSACAATALGYLTFRFNKITPNRASIKTPLPKKLVNRISPTKFRNVTTSTIAFNYIALVGLALFTNYLVTDISRRYGYDKFLGTCLTNVYAEYNKKLNYSYTQEPSTDLRWLTTHLICGDASSISHDAISTMLITIGFYLAGVFSAPLQKF